MRVLLTLVVGCLLLPVAHADEALDEMVVTATRHAEPLKNYAGSLTQIAADDIADVGATHHAALLNRAAGVLFQRNSGQESLTAIRSPVLTGPGSCGSFLFLENSIPVRPVGFCNVNELFEVDTEQARTIEIGRGPASALYGSSAMHGSVNVLQPAPRDLPAFGVRLEEGPSDYYRARVSASALGTDTDVGVSALGEYDGGWRDHATTKQQKLVGSLEHRFGAATASFTLSASNLHQETAGFITGFEAYKTPSAARSNANPEAFRDAHSLRLMGDIALPLSEDTQVDLRPYLRSSRMNFLQHFLVGKPLETNGQDSGGVQLSVDHHWAGGTRLIAGSDLEAGKGTLVEFQRTVATDGTPAANAIRPQGYHYDYDVKSLVRALYAHAEQPLGPFKVTLGARAEWVNYTYDNHMLDGNTRDNGTKCGTAGCLYSRPADRQDGFRNVTPKATLSWAFASSQLLYVNAARGYRAPDTSELYRLQRQQNIADLAPERVDSVELGLRGQLSTLGYTLAVFTMKKDNVIFRDAAGFNFSGGRTKHHGVEYALDWKVLPSLTLALNGTVAKHAYDFSRSIDGGETIVAGRDIDTAPRQVRNARVAWRPVDPVSVELEWQHVGRYWVDAANLHAYAGHDVLDLRGSWQFAPAWRASARLDNVTDRAYADRGDYAFGTYRYFPGRPRTLFLELAYAQRHAVL
jgi:outer membrane receptor protein involved in Fe transport